MAAQTDATLLPNADLPLLEKATNKVFQRFWGKSTAEMMNMQHAEAVEFVQEFSDLVFDMPFQAPENMVLLARCLGILRRYLTPQRTREGDPAQRRLAS